MALTNAQVGEAFVDIRARIDKLDSDFRKARQRTEREANRLSGSFGKVTKSINTVKAGIAGIAGAVAIGSFGRLIKSSLDYADSLDKTSQRLGVNVELLQQYQFAASQSGISTNNFNLALQRFLRRLGEARQGSGELLSTLEGLGINFDRTREGTDVFEDFLRAIDETTDGTEKLRIAFKGFDSEGAALVQVLANGFEGFERLKNQARELGLVLDEGLIKQSVQAKDDLAALAFVMRTQLTVQVAKLAPTISDIARRLTEFAIRAVQVAEAIGLVSRNVRLLSLEELREEISGVNREYQALRAQFIDDRANNVAQASLDKTRERLVLLARELNNLRAEEQRRLNPELPEVNLGGGLVGSQIAAADDEEEARRKRIEDAQKLAIDLEDELLRLRGEEIALADRQFQRELEVLKAIENQEERLAAINNLDRVHAERIDAIVEAYDRGNDELSESQKLWEGLLDAANQFGDDVASTFADILVEGERSFRSLGDAFLIEFVERAIKGLLRVAAFAALGDAAGVGSNASNAFLGGFLGVSNLARGGIVQPPGGLVRVAEAAKPEAIIPLDRLPQQDVQVQVFAPPGEPVRTQRSQNAEVETIRVLVGQVMVEDAERGGPHIRALERRLGVQRRGV